MTDKPGEVSAESDTPLLERIQDEADLCRNEGAQDIANLLDEAARAIDEAQRDTEAIRTLMNMHNLGGWTDAVAPMKRALAAEAELRAVSAVLVPLEGHTHSQTARLVLDELQQLRAYAVKLADELRNIALAKRYDPAYFSDDREFADWAQSRARAALASAPATYSSTPDPATAETPRIGLVLCANCICKRAGLRRREAVKKIWFCKIGETDFDQRGMDMPMRAAVAEAYLRVTGKDPGFIFSGWGTMRMDRGDMLITGVKGEIYPCKPDIFAATYEVAAAPEPPQESAIVEERITGKCCPMCGTPATFEIHLPDGTLIPAASLSEAQGLVRINQRRWPDEDLSIRARPQGTSSVQLDAARWRHLLTCAFDDDFDALDPEHLTAEIDRRMAALHTEGA